MRALALELTNLRLGLVEPWLAGGKPATPARVDRDRPDGAGADGRTLAPDRADAVGA